MAKGQYIRVYHELKDEYPGVWRSDAQLAAFVRLLLIADKWWPEWAPVANRNGAYRSLLEAGLVTENQGGSGYTIKGLGAERGRRSQHGRHAASMRWASSEHAQPMPSKAEHSKAEQMNGQSPSLESVRAQHDREWDPCATCGHRRGGLGHAPGRADHPFRESEGTP